MTLKTVTVGMVRRAHALKGELFVELATDHPDHVFALGRVLEVSGGGPIGMAGRLTVTSARPHSGGYILGVEEIDDRTLAERYRGRRLSVPEDRLLELQEDEFFLHDLRGLELRNEDDEVLGTIAEVHQAGSTAILDVDRDDGEMMVPFVDAIVLEVDVDGGYVRIRPPEGLLDI